MLYTKDIRKVDNGRRFRFIVIFVRFLASNCEFMFRRKISVLQEDPSFPRGYYQTNGNVVEFGNCTIRTVPSVKSLRHWQDMNLFIREIKSHYFTAWALPVKRWGRKESPQILTSDMHVVWFLIPREIFIFFWLQLLRTIAVHRLTALKTLSGYGEHVNDHSMAKWIPSLSKRNVKTSKCCFLASIKMQSLDKTNSKNEDSYRKR